MTEFEHFSSNGTNFFWKRNNVVTVVKPKDISLEQYSSDVAEMIAYHAINVWPNLKEGFSGYDTLHFQIEEEKA